MLLYQGKNCFILLNCMNISFSDNQSLCESIYISVKKIIKFAVCNFFQLLFLVLNHLLHSAFFRNCRKEHRRLCVTAFIKLLCHINLAFSSCTDCVYNLLHHTVIEFIFLSVNNISNKHTNRRNNAHKCTD